MTFHTLGNDTVSLEEVYGTKKNKEFKPFLVDIWSNVRYGDKQKAEHYGQVYTVKITENISENLLFEILKATAKAHFNHDNNTQESTDFDYSFGYEISEIEPKPFLVPFYHSVNDNVKLYYRHVVIMAIDLEEARTKAEELRKHITDPVASEQTKITIAMYSLGDANKFDPVMIEEINPHEYKFLIKHGTFISCVVK